MKKIILSLLVLGVELIGAKSLSFEHHDWQVVCDNTNTCRIAGYSSDEVEQRVSVLFTRKAGKNQVIEAQIQLAYVDEEDEKIFKKLPSVFNLEMMINGKSYGFISMKQDEFIASLSKKQIEVLLSALSKVSRIVWKTKNYGWVLSDKGASAVLLKADEFQKRIGTQEAFLKKGVKSEKNVLKAKRIPLLNAKALPSVKKISINLKYMKNLDRELSMDEEECFSTNEEENSLALYALTSNKLLASKLCWRGAYNSASAYWVINNKPPFSPKLITTSGTDYYVNKAEVGIISGSHKGRGLGDCWSFEESVWTGKTFELSSRGTTGLCKLIVAGGAWELPTFVSEVKEE